MSTRSSHYTLCLLLASIPLYSGCDDGGEPSDDGAGEIDDPNCDALLTPTDFEDICGTALTLEPTAFEGIELNPCNRESSAGEAIFLVSRHTSASVAQMGADIAGGRGPSAQGELQVSAGAASVFVVEIKAPDRADAVCAADTLPQLLDVALSRIE